MKIAILTQPLRGNYGGILQAYALQSVLRSMGHKVITINRMTKPVKRLTPSILFYRCGSFIKCIVRRYIKKDNNVTLSNPFAKEYTPYHTLVFLKSFITKHIHRSHPIYSTEELTRYAAAEQFDAYVVGSDQVWREIYSPCITDFFLDFLSESNSAKRIAYAASFGTETDFISAEKLPRCKELLRMFDFISVRERSGIDIVRNTFSLDAAFALDPTLLLSATDYRQLIDKHDINRKHGLTTYILDPDANKDSIIADVMDTNHQQRTVLSLNEAENKSNPGIMWSISEWLGAIANADFVITDSFHGCVFSIIFRKPFIAIANTYRGLDRFTSLLGTFGLMDRLVFNHEQYQTNRASLLKPIDYTTAEQELLKYKAHSLKLLSSATAR